MFCKIFCSTICKNPHLKSRLLVTKPLTYFSSRSEQLKKILKTIAIIGQNNQASNILDSGIVHSQHIDPQTNKVTIALKLNKDYRRIKAILKDSLQKQGFNNLDIILAQKSQSEKDKSLRKGNLSQIKKIVAVSSCKGGVGKSTVAINTAAKLQQMGFKVGIFDSDIYGPSLPTLINKQGQLIQPAEDNPKQIIPIDYEGIVCMSFGFVGNKAAIMRGPIISSIVSQLIHQTRWGQLDYLVVDMPPGTGDIQISLCQQLKFDGAVIVSTPQRLAYMDVIKGIQMFQQLRVPILGVVQNMAYYQCSKCGSIDQIFGKGYTKMLQDQFGIENTVKFPLMSQISKYSDVGAPFVFVLPEQHFLCIQYKKLCQNIKKEMEKPRINPIAYYNTSQRLVIIEHQNKKKKINPLMLRSLCRCAGCIDELSGALLVKKQKLDPQVYPVRVEEKGNYAVAMVWSDGHKSSIYPYKRLLSEDIPSVD